MKKWKCFTPEEVEALRQNPYTHTVTAQTISFTTEFKRIFWEKSQAGQTPSEIMREMGYDPEVLGQSRISGIKSHIKEQIWSEEGIHAGRKSVGKGMKEDDLKQLSSSKSMIKMANELAYLRQEVEFIKKTIQMGNRKKQGK